MPVKAYGYKGSRLVVVDTPTTGNPEAEALSSVLERNRRTFAWKV